MQLHLNSYGVYLHVKDAMFDVRHKQPDGTWSSRHIAAHKVKSIWLNKGTALSSDAVHLALYNNIDIVFLENNGTPVGRVWHSKLGSTTRVRKCQLEASLDQRAFEYTKVWIAQKIRNQADFIKDLKKHRAAIADYLQHKIDRIEALELKIIQLEPTDLPQNWASLVQGIEGTAGRLYFETLSYVLPAQWQFSGRSTRPAADAFNAFLNYAYGVLYARVEKSLMLAGADPYVGFLHRDDYNYKSMVYDFIEPFRQWADKVVFSLFSGKKVNQGHFSVVTGGVSLNAEGKKLLMEHYNAYLESDLIRYKGRNRSRASILLLEAHRFAQELMQASPVDADEAELLIETL